ncbi:MAG: C4-type zinc ribbon domain-containing protein, partial [Elusimicrobiota bacterium]|nr:C4-type zinc ribbon domain-containing protein [Elusimicrobiota bacterium]
QYKALLSEISKIEGERSKIEDEILQLMETIDKQNQTITEIEKTIKQKELEAENSIRTLEEKQKELETQINIQQNEREKIVKIISDATIKKYEHIRKVKEDGVAIAPIEDTNCGNCRIKLTAQIINEVSKCDKLVYCDNCSRILYLSEPIEQSTQLTEI